MADVTKTVEIVFGAVNNTGEVISSIGSGISDFATQAQTAISPLNDLADAIKLADTAIVGLGLAFGGYALQKAGEFRDSVSEIGILFSGTKDDVRLYGDEILNYASNSTKGLGDITGALKEAVGSGVEWKNSIEFLAAAENLALGASGDLTTATSTLVGAMNSYGASTNDAGKYTDILMQAVLYGKMNLPELETSLANVTSTAAAAKVPFDDVGAALAALTAAGLPTSQAVTALNQVIAQYISPTKEAADAAKSMGIEFDANALASKGLKGALDEAMDATGGQVDKMSALFGSVDSLKGALILGADKAGTFRTALDAMKDASGTAADAAETLRQNWENGTQAVQNALDVMMVAVGDKLNEGGEFSGVLDGLRGIFSSLTFSIGEGAFDSVFETLRTLAERLGTFLKDIAENLPAALEQVDFDKFNDSLTRLFDSLAGLFDGVDLTTPEGLADAIQLVVDTIANLLNQGSGIVDTWGEAFDAALPLIQAFADMSDEAAAASGKVLGIADVLDKVLPLVGDVSDALDLLGIAMTAVAAKSGLDFVTTLGSIASKAPGAGTAIAGITTVLGVAGGTVGLVGGAAAAGYGLGTLLNDGIDAVVQKLTDSGSLGGLIYDLTHSAEDLAAEMPDVAAAIRDVGDAAVDAGTPVSTLKDSFADQERSADDLQRMHGLLETATNSSAWAAGEAKAKAEFLKDAHDALAVATGKVKEKTEIVKDEFGNLTTATSATRDKMREAADAYLATAEKAGNLAEAKKLVRAEFEKLDQPVENVKGKLSSSKDVMEELAGKTNLTNKELIDLAKNARDAEVKLEQIASNERIKLIESKVKLDIAEVEANAKVATALLDNMAKTYQADTGLIGELSKQLTNGYSEADKFRMKLIEDANKRVEELHNGQMKLIDAQVAYMRAKTNAMAAGNPVMTINAEGLQPHLESMMWEVFKQIQVKMAQDGGDLIVGGISL